MTSSNLTSATSPQQEQLQAQEKLLTSPTTSSSSSPPSVSTWRTGASYQILAPLASLIGGIVVWIGVWDCCVDYFYQDTSNYDVLYLVIGLLLLFATRTVIAQAGLKPVVLMPKSTVDASSSSLERVVIFVLNRHAIHVSDHISFTDKLFLALRSLLALLAGIIFWIGTYNLFDLRLFGEASMQRDLLYVLVGLGLMFATSNVGSEGTAVIVDSIDHASSLSSTSSALSATHSSSSSTSNASLPSSSTTHNAVKVATVGQLLFYYVKALVGLLGDIIYWNGIYSFVDVDLWEYNLVRDSLYVTCALLTFLSLSVSVQQERELWRRKIANTMYSSSDGLVHVDSISSSLTWSHAKTSADKVSYVTRTSIAMIAGAFLWAGMWNCLSYYIIDRQAVGNEAEEEIEANTLSHHFQLTSTLQPLSSFAMHDFHILQRTQISTSTFPLWLLYLVYVCIGVFLLVVTNTLTLTAGSVQPISLIRAPATEEQEEMRQSSESDERDSQSTTRIGMSTNAHDALSNAVS